MAKPRKKKLAKARAKAAAKKPAASASVTRKKKAGTGTGRAGASAIARSGSAGPRSVSEGKRAVKGRAGASAIARSGSAGPRSVSEGKRAVKKKRPLREPVKKAKRAPSKPPRTHGARPDVSTRQTLPEFARDVKRKASPVRAKPLGKKKRTLSRTREAVRARRYRAERRAIAEALEVLRLEKLAQRRARASARRATKRGLPPAPAAVAELAVGWLERIRDHAAGVEPCSLSVVPHAAGDVHLWVRVGRFDFASPIDYEAMGAVLDRISHDAISRGADPPRPRLADPDQLVRPKRAAPRERRHDRADRAVGVHRRRIVGRDPGQWRRRPGRARGALRRERD